MVHNKRLFGIIPPKNNLACFLLTLISNLTLIISSQPIWHLSEQPRLRNAWPGVTICACADGVRSAISLDTGIAPTAYLRRREQWPWGEDRLRASLQKWQAGNGRNKAIETAPKRICQTGKAASLPEDGGPIFQDQRYQQRKMWTNMLHTSSAKLNINHHGMSGCSAETTTSAKASRCSLVWKRRGSCNNSRNA